MNLVLQNMCWKCYLHCLHDIVIFSKSFDDHLHHLQKVFDCLQSAGFRLLSEKRHFAATSINFLGHVITKNGVELDPKKVSPIIEYPEPLNHSQLRRFLVLTNYHRLFTLNYSVVTSPLTPLLARKSQPKASLC